MKCFMLDCGNLLEVKFQKVLDVQEEKKVNFCLSDVNLLSTLFLMNPCFLFIHHIQYFQYKTKLLSLE